MNPFRKLYEGIRDKVFGRTRDDNPTPQPWGRRRYIQRLDQGPATQKYVRSLFPHGCFTKKLTPARENQIREVFRRLRPEQRRIALAYGYNKGLRV